VPCISHCLIFSNECICAVLEGTVSQCTLAYQIACDLGLSYAAGCSHCCGLDAPMLSALYCSLHALVYMAQTWLIHNGLLVACSEQACVRHMYNVTENFPTCLVWASAVANCNVGIGVCKLS
jgi:hypothetical protein